MLEPSKALEVFQQFSTWFYHDINDLDDSDIWYFNTSLTLVAHIVNHNVRDKNPNEEALRV